ncbi:hypothetical protein QRX50_14185 [Amycolatopsis carbonis]|uniref:FAD-dependent oxidoreductase n=1 Tax=Amycolatopsis carbonis TaxID=715471 RepID=A0A9Y2MYN5_9PSEU|nr:hypothetical protein [Amycolatopsis sp. 2-15]WIX81818.1 hypothetical protein QRX50_14185 [Amycolatopsis sp. 2-15]
MQLERWFPGFPGFAKEAVAEDAVLLPEDGSGFAFFINGEPAMPLAAEGKVEAPVLVSSRPFLENLVRRRALAVENITLVAGRADGLVFERDRVAGARYVPEGGEESVFAAADIVVDAMGRSSRVSDWLEDGWPRPPLRRMPIKLNYSVATFEYDPTISKVVSSVSQTMPDARTGRIARVGGIARVEGQRWHMVVAGYDDDRSTRDPDEFIARCNRDFPALYGDIASHATMIGDIATYHQADSRRRDFDELDRVPAGLFAAGDSVASSNPIYGQGMTSAMLHASCLSQYLRSQPDLAQPAKAYFDLVRLVVDSAWQTSTLADLELPHVDGPYPKGDRLTKWFSDVMLKASRVDPVINGKLAAVTTILAHPDTLSGLGTVLRALRFSRRKA